MKFKGVVTKKGANRGDVIEYSPEEKVRAALALALTQHADFDDYLVHPGKITLGKVEISKKGDPLKRLWQNNVYEASGTVEVNRRHKAKDQLMRPLTLNFTIKAEDCLCPNGLPDLKTLGLELLPV